MNKIILRVFALALLLAVSACKESFLETVPEQSLDSGLAIQDLPTLRAAVSGVYSNLQSSNLYGRTLYILPDLLADNTFISRANANRYTANNENRVIATDGFYAGIWNQAYIVISNASRIIQGVNNVTFSTTEQAESKNIQGEAYTLRALMHFELVRHFAQPYNFTANASHPGIPLILDVPPGETLAPSRNTVAEVYAGITSDLNAALPLLTIKKNGRVTLEFAKGLLAKVYLYMGRWADAEKLCTEIIDSKRFKLYDQTNFVSSWSAKFGTESLFEVVNLSDDNAGTDNLGYFYEQSGYGDGLATEDIYNQYSATDARRGVIEKGKRNQANGENPAYIIHKYPKGASTRDDNMKIMRFAEVYLMRAEARAEQSKEALALEDLNLVAKRCDPSAATISASGQALIDAIILERRKELAFEGDRLFDLMRRKITFTKYQSTTVSRQVTPPNDLLIGPIPQREIDANKNIGTQNPGY